MANYRIATNSREEEGALCRLIYQAAASNPYYCKWRHKTIKAYEMAEGKKLGHYTRQELIELWGRDQYPYIVNIARAYLNQCSSVEVVSRSRFAYRLYTGENDANDIEYLSTGITHLGYAFQEHEHTAEYTSMKYYDGLVCGLGWSSMYSYRDKIHYKWISPMNKIYDANDISPFLTDSTFDITLHWMDVELVKQTWPKYAKRIDESYGKNRVPTNLSSFSEEFTSNVSPYIGASMVTSACGNKLLVVEVQRKKNRLYYKGISASTRYEFQTFSEEDAEKMEPDGDLEEVMGYEILRTVICGDIVLDHAPLQPHIPNMQFSYVPYVYYRRRLDGVPLGLIHAIKDNQKLYNRMKIDEDNSRSGMTVIATSGAFSNASPEDVRMELSQKNKLLIEAEKDSIRVVPNIGQAEANLKGLQRSDLEFDKLTGMFAEARGEATNATSGKAEQTRAVNSMTSQSVPLSGLVLMKKREGLVFLDLLQGGGFEDIQSTVIRDEEREIIYMNVVHTRGDKKILTNDIRTIPFNVYVENTHDYESEAEEDMAIARFILENPNAMLYLQQPELLGLLKSRNSGKFVQKIKGIMGGGQQPQNPSQGVPPSSTPNPTGVRQLAAAALPSTMPGAANAATPS